MSTTTQYEDALSRLVGHDLVTVVAVELEGPWHPKSPLDIPRPPRPIGGVPIRRKPLGEVIEHNKATMQTRVHHWWVVTELLANAEELSHGRRDTAADRSRSTDAENNGNGRRRDTEYSDPETTDCRGDRREVGSDAAAFVDAAGCKRQTAADGTSRQNVADASRRIDEEAFQLLGRVSTELRNAVFEQAKQLASTRAVAQIECQDIRKAAEIITVVGTPRRIRWDLVDTTDRKGGE